MEEICEKKYGKDDPECVFCSRLKICQAQDEGKIARSWAEPKGGRFTMVPRILIADTRLSPEAKLVGIALASFDGKKDGRIFPGNESLCEVIGRTEPMIIKYKKELEKCGYLKQTMRYSQTNEYTISVPLMKSLDEFTKNFAVMHFPMTMADLIFEIEDSEGDKILLVDISVKKEFESFFGIIDDYKREYRNWKRDNKDMLQNAKKAGSKRTPSELKRIACNQYLAAAVRKAKENSRR